MKKKLLTLTAVPVVAIVAFVTFNSFTGTEETPPKCYWQTKGETRTVNGVSVFFCDGTGSTACAIQVPCP